MADHAQTLFICYPRCSTCAKARAWLDGHGVDYVERDIKTDNPTYEELKRWWQLSGLPVKRFFNTSGMSYRRLEADQRPDALGDDEALHLLATDGMLVKRPILVDDGQVLVGFRMSDWEGHLNAQPHKN
ncbi:ArsC family protein [Bifidobacterium actinocoloniiforme DSM 22766]|uniref:ArsC family protein n=2 Tax=Bifidobacterium actinocoloniiforme TaxID=638619 RepID=A0A086Z0Y2_9BIFI|nr:ArsC family transcriptional regulator [Bifidobacterium actinocoloniiforme DSM 22766]KFI40182.1 ArsC family protein [Bifidobacterium actinocoloniiforme DSM 22766]